MKLLAVESSAVSAGAALFEDDKLIGECFLNVGLTHSETLLPMVEQLLHTTGLSAKDIDCFAAAHGPGSFTGVRIGVAAVKGLAFANHTPCIGVSSLEAMAYQLKGNTCYASCVMDARRNQVYHALFRITGETVERMKEDEAVPVEGLAKEIAEFDEFPYIFIGDGADLCYNTLIEQSKRIELAPEHLRYQRASGVAMAARRAYLDGQAVESGRLVPVYLRPSQAERELKLKKGNG